MKRHIKKWVLRFTATALLIAGLLLIIVLNPILTYAHSTTHANFTIYHNKPIDPALTGRLDQATGLLQSSELYDPALKLDICLNDGSAYPDLMKTMRGRAFAWGFYNKVVLQGHANYKDNYIELSGYRWNLTQLLAHEMTHCLQFARLGLWKSKPFAAIPDWKWEGYAEYVSRHSAEQMDLFQNITRLNTTDTSNWAISFPDSTISPRAYYDYWTLVQYCMDIRRMNFNQLLSDTTSEKAIRQEMGIWISGQQKSKAQ